MHLSFLIVRLQHSTPMVLLERVSREADKIGTNHIIRWIIFPDRLDPSSHKSERNFLSVRSRENDGTSSSATYHPCRDGPNQHKIEAENYIIRMKIAHTANNLIILTLYKWLPPGWQLDVAVLSEWGHENLLHHVKMWNMNSAQMASSRPQHGSHTLITQQTTA